MSAVTKLCEFLKPSRAALLLQITDDDASVIERYSEKIQMPRPAPFTFFFQHLVTMCTGIRANQKTLPMPELTELQIAEYQFQQLTRIDCKADSTRERELGFARLHFGTSFLVAG